MNPRENFTVILAELRKLANGLSGSVPSADFSMFITSVERMAAEHADMLDMLKRAEGFADDTRFGCEIADLIERVEKR